MEDNEIIIKEIAADDTLTLEAAAFLVAEFSWGHDYPVHPIDEIVTAEYRVGAFHNDKPVGFASVTRNVSFDYKDPNALWFAHEVVIPEFRRQGIFKLLYAAQMDYALSKPDRILSGTDNADMEKFYLEHGWKEIQKTTDAAGETSLIFEYIRP